MDKKDDVLDVLIVGAGAAGIGVGLVLQALNIQNVKINFKIIERDQIGASFRRWPREMRFISPSFNGNPFGLMDLNSIALQTSPAYTLDTEHPSGEQYAAYLQGVAKNWELPIETGIELTSMTREADEFRLQTSAGSLGSRGHLRSRFVIWAAGEFQYPKTQPFTGADLCLHNSLVESWANLKGKEFVVVGGYESAIDAAIHLARLGKKVRVLDDEGKWDYDDPDPSIALSPYTKGRLRTALQTGLVELIKDARVSRVEKNAKRWAIQTEAGDWIETGSQPILATGFHSSAHHTPDLWEFRDDGMPLLTEHDESTRVPGLFLVGPSVRQGTHIFCYIYKFRQRFAVVVNQIAQRLHVDVAPLEEYRRNNMFLDDLSCCGEGCAKC